MPRFMLDTDTCIYIIKNYPEKLRERFNQSASELCISSITLGELRFGAEKSARRADNLREVAAFVGRLEVLPFGEEAAAHFGDIRASLERRSSRTSSGMSRMKGAISSASPPVMGSTTVGQAAPPCAARAAA